MRVMVLCSSFNGLSQRVWLDLRDAEHDVGLQVGGDADAMRAAVVAFDPELVVCPFLRERVPAQVWRRWRTIVIHPGPLGDRGPSSLDWAITEGVRSWGVTAIQAVEELDAGPVWATRAFPMPPGPPSKSSLYNGPVADAAVALVREVVARAADPEFVPRALDQADPELPGRSRPAMRRSDRAFCWADATAQIVARVSAADGSPGVATELCGQPVSAFDAHPGPDLVGGEPGDVVARRHGGLLVRTGDGTVWIGQIRSRAHTSRAIKLPASLALADELAGVPGLRRTTVGSADRTGFREIGYQRHGRVGVLSFDVYNGAMSTDDCRRLATAVRRAAARDTRVLVIRGGPTFSNGIHLGVVDADPDPAAAAWANLGAIDDVCREIITATSQLVVTAVTGNAGAGGVMLALGADRVLLRDGVVLNPHYATMGLFGSEYWTYVLPRRVGEQRALQLTEQCLPIGVGQALRIGLADAVLPGSREDADLAAVDYAARLAGSRDYHEQLAGKRVRRARDERRRPLDTYRAHELAEMHRDIYDDRRGFAAARHAFATRRPAPTAAGPVERRYTLPGGPELAGRSVHG